MYMYKLPVMLTTKKDEILAIHQVVKDYLYGVIFGKFTKIEESWHIEGRRIETDPDNMQILFKNSPASNEYKNFKSSPEIRQRGVIKDIEVTENIAKSTLIWFLESNNWKITCTDYLLLIKENKKWIIVSKVSNKIKKVIG